MITRDDIAPLLGPDWKDTRLTLVEDAPAQPAPLRRLVFRTQTGEEVPALYLPSRTGATALYCHAHGNRYDIGINEVTQGRPALHAPYLPDFIARGWGLLCLELPCFGTRAHQSESATAKARLWQGRTLFGQMLGEERAALAWLADQPETDADRIAVMGISMGGTLAWWLGALQPGFAAIVSIACFADLHLLIDSGAHDGHGPYMTVPGVLPVARSGQIAGLSAPTPALHCVGLKDWSTPPDAFQRAADDLRACYATDFATVPTQLGFVIDPDCGHAETAQMRIAILRFLDKNLEKQA